MTTESHSIDLAQLGTGLVRDEAGIWRPRTERSYTLSIPADCHAVCFGLEDDSFWYAHRSACITAVLAREQLDGPLLDIGGGNGAVSSALDRAHIETVLLEPSDEGARNATLRGLRNVACATLDDAEFASGAFCAAGMFDVVEHIEDDAALLRSVHRVLRPGGILCVTVPAYGWLWSAADEVAGHHRRYTLGSLRAVLARSGFAVRYETYIFAALTAPIFALRSLPHRLLRRSQVRVDSGGASQHTPSPLLRRGMNALLAPELQLIRAGRRVPFGTSCLAVAVRS